MNEKRLISELDKAYAILDGVQGKTAQDNRTIQYVLDILFELDKE